MTDTFYQKIFQAHQTPKRLPGTSEIDSFILELLQFLFPELNEQRFTSRLALETAFQKLQLTLCGLLNKTQACNPDRIDSICNQFFEQLEKIYDLCMEDMQAILEGDPAATDQKEVIRSYPGFFAIAVYRIAHLMLQLDIPYLPRILTEYAHSQTGIDIHPAARIGRSFCIDHGTGVVIGETTVIGEQVKIYQGVTLGALSISKEMAKQKRHPTIGDRVVIYAGTTILGGETIIGHDSIIGGNVWITESIPPNSKVYFSNGQQILKEAEA